MRHLNDDSLHRLSFGYVHLERRPDCCRHHYLQTSQAEHFRVLSGRVESHMFSLLPTNPCVQPPAKHAIGRDVQDAELPSAAEHSMDFFQSFHGLSVVVKGVCAEHRIEKVVFKRQPFGAGDFESDVLHATCRSGNFDHPRRKIDSAERSVVPSEGRNLPNGLARSATEVQKVDSSLDVETGKRLSLHPAEVIKSPLVVGFGASVPLASVALLMRSLIAFSWIFRHGVNCGPRKQALQDRRIRTATATVDRYSLRLRFQVAVFGRTSSE